MRRPKPSPPARATPDPSRRMFHWVRALLVAAAVLVGAIILLLTEAEASVRAFIHSEGLWSKGQKSAMIALTQYLLTRDDAEYARFEQSIRIPLGDHLARTELQKARPDYALVR